MKMRMRKMKREKAPRIEVVTEWAIASLGRPCEGAMTGPKLANTNVPRAYRNAKISRIGNR